MAYLREEELALMGFRVLGRNVKVSSKASIYDCHQIEIGENSRIDDFCVLSGKINIGKHVHLAPFCLIAGGIKGVTLEDFSGCAYGVQVFSQSDDYSGKAMTNSTIPARFRNELKKGVLIKKHCIIGAGSIIMPGVTLGEGTSVGAMSLIRKTTEEWSTYNGIPGVKIKDRRRDLLVLEKEFLESGGYE
ncbi:MAG: acyltransferase [Candidatus Omnitrophota bacterium]